MSVKSLKYSSYTVTEFCWYSFQWWKCWLLFPHAHN